MSADNRSKPAFTDASTCEKWLTQFQLTNLTLAHSTLRAQLDMFNQLPMRAKERLRTLETLRETVSVVQTDFAKRLVGKKLPLSDDEFTTLITLSNLWIGMLNGYMRCLEALDGGDSSVSSDETLIYHRCMLYCGLQISEFLHVGNEPDGKSWQRFHSIYAQVEARGAEKTMVTDKLSRAGRVSCRTLYAKTLLLHRARLLGMRRNQWPTLDHWLDRWGDAFTIETSCSMSRDDAPPLAVDLVGPHGLIPIQQATSATSMRFMAMVPVSKLIRVKTILLQQGQTPRQLELGEDMSGQDCINLLNRLHACWCEQRRESMADEPRDAPVIKFCAGLEYIYAHIAGKPFKPPNISSVSEKEEQQQIETFGRVLDATDRHNLMQLGFLAEDWLVDDDGILHGRLLRKSKAGDRIGMNQIVCIHKPEGVLYKLGIVTAANVNRTGQLYIGVRYLPGLPQATIMRGSPSGNLLSGAAAVLALPEMTKLRIPASIIIPRDWFAPGRRVELTIGENPKQPITLGISVERGLDYERVSYSAAV